MSLQESNKFWEKMVLIYSVLCVLFTLSFAIIIPFLFPEIFELLMNLLTNDKTQNMSEDTLHVVRFCIGIYGAIGIAWTLNLTYYGYRLVKNSEEWIWPIYILNILIWFFLEESIALISGSIFLLISNLLIIILLIPIAYFNKEKIISGFRSI